MDIVRTLVDPKNLLTAFSAVVAFAAVVTVARPWLKTDSLGARMKAVANRREELRRRSREAMVKDSSTLRHRDESWYKKIVERLKLSTLLEDPKVIDKLAQAGFRGPKPVSTFYFFRFALPFVFCALAGLYLFVLNSFGLPVMTRLFLTMAATVAGFYAPNIYITNTAAKRRTSIVQAFPDALDLLLICVESGMSIEAALQKVSQEIGASSIELAEELSLLVAELSYLPDRRLAYEGISKRVNDPGIKSVSTAMIQAEQYGTPLGSALRVMSKENRDLRLSAAEKKASALPAKLTVPMIIFFLPVLFLVIMGPAVLRTIDMQH
ncbi:MAG: type II secretion system F family protein [Caulobacteraceae bacterium]